MPSLVTAVLWLPMTMQEASSGKLTFDLLASVAAPVERPPHDAVVLCPQQWLDRVVVASPSRLRRALHCRHSHSCSAPTGAVLLEVRDRAAATPRFFTHPTASFACHLHSVSKSNAVSQVITTVGLTVKHPDVKVEQITKQVRCDACAPHTPPALTCGALRIAPHLIMAGGSAVQQYLSVGLPGHCPNAGPSTATCGSCLYPCAQGRLRHGLL